MASKLIKLGLQHCIIGAYQRVPRALPTEHLKSLTSPQFLHSSHIRKFSLSPRVRQDGEERQVDPAKDRRVPIPVETSIRYLKSKAYREAYEDKPVWFFYRRNHKGLIPPPPKQTCISAGIIISGNPCPICRDEYLVLHYTNVELLKQFIDKQSGQVISVVKTGLCARQYQSLLAAIEKAKDYGTITFDLPLRKYDYKDYIPKDLHFK
nr:PREDICTED: 28S ribosomal protein S18b, mitochondrial isoform X2 [Bemisia tabaci]